MGLSFKDLASPISMLGSGGVKSFLFGDKPSANVSSHSLMSPEQEKALKQILAQLTGGNKDITQGYTGQLTAGPNKLQGDSLAAMEAMAMNAVTGGNDGASSEALNSILKMRQPDLTDYFTNTIDKPAMQLFQQELMPELTRRFAGQAGFGSDRMVQEGIAAGNTMTGIAKARGEASQAALRDLMNAQIGAAGTLSGIRSADVERLLGLQRGGGIAQDTAQKPLTAEYEEFKRQIGAKEQTLQDILAALGLQTKENIGLVKPGTQGFLQGASGGFGQGAAMAMLGGSDPNIKENVKLVGTTAHNLPLYEFNYIGDPDNRFRGVMSTDVELVMPEAVIKGTKYDMVDYSMLGIKLEKVLQ